MLIVFLTVFLVQLPNCSGKPVECGDFNNCTECANATDFLGLRCDWCGMNAKCLGTLFNFCPLHFRNTLPYNCPESPPKAVAYSDTYARRVALPLAAATYARTARQVEECLHNNFIDALLVAQYSANCDPVNSTICNGYLAYLTEEDTIVVAFAGMQSSAQFVQQTINYFFFKQTKILNATGGTIDRYYHDAFYSLWDNGLQNDLSHLKEKLPESKLLVVGYSLGGALASICSAVVVEEMLYRPDMVQLITFGQPRIGDVKWASGHDVLVPNSFRIVHNHDPVPTLPPRAALESPDRGPFHHRYEVWYPNDMSIGSKYTVCESAEDGACSNAHINLVIDDHTVYFGRNLTQWWLDGCAV